MSLVLSCDVSSQAHTVVQVLSIDIFPSEIPEHLHNLNLECDDLNQSLTEVYESNMFDVVCSRFVEAGIHKNRWPSYIKDLVKSVRPA